MTTGSDKKAKCEASNVRRGRVRALGETLQPITRQALGSRCLAEATLIAEWPTVAGEDTARLCQPRHLRFPKRDIRRDGTLTLRVKPAEATRLSYREPVLVERINAFFGYRAVARLRLEQGPLKQRERYQPPQQRELAPEEAQYVSKSVAEVEDPELRAVLERLGRAVQAKGGR